MPPRWFWISALFALVAAQRLGELWLARRWLAPEQGVARASIVTEPGYGWMVALHSAWLVGGWAEGVWMPAFTDSSWLIPPGVLWGIALGLRFWMLAALGPLWHVRVVARPEQPIVTTGPYRFIRHPNYLAVILEIAAVPLLAGAVTTALIASLGNVLVLRHRIRLEEAYLLRHPAYREAFSGRARFIPGLF